eukprot:TRINITY_DN2416_c0_g1_i1.p1 TRINITY_DN2416_c0_g1~~TRINITY_DN2416_c0_g1_i1.p1  ORF type:complete len:247 (+),score=39.22 TRINITY_DN2416_c0_g1_i1:36-776(+)
MNLPIVVLNEDLHLTKSSSTQRNQIKVRGDEHPSQQSILSKQNGNSNKQRRRQVKTACTLCRKSHAACDDTRPCSRCVKLGQPELCIDEPRKRRISEGSDMILPPLKQRKSLAQSTEELLAPPSSSCPPVQKISPKSSLNHLLDDRDDHMSAHAGSRGYTGYQGPSFQSFHKINLSLPSTSSPPLPVSISSNVSPFDVRPVGSPPSCQLASSRQSSSSISTPNQGSGQGPGLSASLFEVHLEKWVP